MLSSLSSNTAPGSFSIASMGKKKEKKTEGGGKNTDNLSSFLYDIRHSSSSIDNNNHLLNLPSLSSLSSLSPLSLSLPVPPSQEAISVGDQVNDDDVVVPWDLGLARWSFLLFPLLSFGRAIAVQSPVSKKGLSHGWDCCCCAVRGSMIHFLLNAPTKQSLSRCFYVQSEVTSFWSGGKSTPLSL